LSFEVKFEDKQVRAFFKRASTKLDKVLETSLRKTAIYGISEIPNTLPRRTGNLRGSYTIKKKNRFERLLFSSLPAQAETLESGRKARVIYPKRGKFLTIPTTDSVLTPTRSHIKQLSDSAFKKALKKRKHKRYGDIVLAKKAVQKAIPGKFYIKKKLTPKVDKFLLKETEKNIKKVLNNA
jgi:hypothetical protein